MVCGNFILAEPASYVFFCAVFNLRNLLYLIGMRTEWRQNCDCGECLILKNTKKFGIFCKNQKIPNILVDLKRLELSTSRMRTERSPS